MADTPIYLTSGILSGVGQGRSVFAKTDSGTYIASAGEISLGGDTYATLRPEVATALGGRLITRTEYEKKQATAGVSAARVPIQKQYWEFSSDVSGAAYMSDVFSTRTIKGNNLKNTLKDLAPVAAIVAAPFAVAAVQAASVAGASGGAAAASGSGGSIAGQIATQGSTLGTFGGATTTGLATSTGAGTAATAAIGSKAAAAGKTALSAVKTVGEAVGAATSVAGLVKGTQSLFSPTGDVLPKASDVTSIGVYPGDPNQAQPVQIGIEPQQSSDTGNLIGYALLAVAALFALRMKGI